MFQSSGKLSAAAIVQSKVLIALSGVTRLINNWFSADLTQSTSHNVPESNQYCSAVKCIGSFLVIFQNVMARFMGLTDESLISLLTGKV